MALEIIIDAAGIRGPDYPEALAYFQEVYQGIYGPDLYLGNDTQDGQFLGVLALAYTDGTVAAAINTYNSFRPGFAQGVGLANLVKINGLTKRVPTRSSVDVLLVGQAGAEIFNGQVGDEQGVSAWNLPAYVVIPVEGEILVTAQAVDLGAVAAAPNSITKILTPMRGWQTVNNPNAAAPGAPLESDAALRQRQRTSTMQPTRTVLEGIVGAVQAVPGVLNVTAYENDSGSTDSNTLPEHSISLIVEGGDATEIAQTIARRKTPGGDTYGDVTVNIFTSDVPTPISFFRPVYVPLAVEIDIEPLAGYSTTIGNKLRQAVVDYVNGLGDGKSIYHGRLYTPANLNGLPEGDTYEVVEIRVSKKPAPPAVGNVAILFKERATLALADVALDITP